MTNNRFAVSFRAIVYAAMLGLPRLAVPRSPQIFLTISRTPPRHPTGHRSVAATLPLRQPISAPFAFRITPIGPASR